MNASLITALDDVAQELEERGSDDLAFEVDDMAYAVQPPNDHLEEELTRTGFDEILRRNPDVADEIFDQRIEPMPNYLSLLI